MAVVYAIARALPGGNYAFRVLLLLLQVVKVLACPFEAAWQPLESQD